jgi:heme oxygenase
MSSPVQPPTEAAGPVRQFLRQHTHAAHVALNHHPMLSGITHPGYPILRYQALLAAYLPLYAGLELAIEQYLSAYPPVFDYRPRRKLHWLVNDLAFFGHHAALTPAATPPIGNLAELIGVLYVIEGSTLGGGLIARLITQHLGIDAEQGGAFFNAYGVDTQTRWQAFCTFIETIAASPAQQALAAQRAVTTFKQFQQALDSAAEQPGLCAEQEAG